MGDIISHLQYNGNDLFYKIVIDKIIFYVSKIHRPKIFYLPFLSILYRNTFTLTICKIPNQKTLICSYLYLIYE